MQEFRALGKHAEPSRNLETFPHSGGELVVVLKCTEFTCRCPVTGQPDWATITISYSASERIVESKSVKLYLETYRDKGIFHEHLAMQILTDFIEALDPGWCTVEVAFNTRGGVAITATAGGKDV